MHELSLAQNIIEIIHQYVPEDQSGDVRQVRIKVGPLAGVVPDSLDFCFNAIVSETPLSHARLDIEETSLQSHCAGCDSVFSVDGDSFLCPSCGKGEIRIISGTELQVVEIVMSDQQAGKA